MRYDLISFLCIALLLPKEHCDSIAHGNLRETLEYFKDAPGITIEEDEPMEEDDHEEGECTTVSFKKKFKL